MGFGALFDDITRQAREDPSLLEGASFSGATPELQSLYQQNLMNNLPEFASPSFDPVAAGLMSLNQAPQSNFQTQGTDFNQLAGLLAGPIPDIPERTERQTFNAPQSPAFNPRPISFNGSTIIPPETGGMNRPPFITPERVSESVAQRNRRIQPAPVGAPLDPELAERIRRGLI